MSMIDYVNYKKVLGSALSDSQVQEVVADFLNHCLKHCDQTKEVIREVVNECLKESVR